MHWADVVASRLSGDISHKVATGITPSGHIHVGNMREILTGDLVHRAALDKGLGSTLHYLADDFDPLRKVYPFLPASYAEHVGKPLSEIPAPDGSERTYAEYFLEPFLRSLEDMGVRPVVLRSSESYRTGKYAKAIEILLDSTDKVSGILTSVSGRELDENYIPYNPKCSQCGRINSTTPTAWEKPFVAYTCKCGHSGKADTRTDDGKLPWRLDWPARWWWLGVTGEPFGKDHAAAGGSYDTASRIIKEVLGGEPPFPVIYEWIQLKGKGAMHSSTGVVVTGAEMLRMTPPEVLRFFIARSQPSRHLDMDPGLGILTLVDDFDRYEEEYLKHDPSAEAEDSIRTYQLSMVDPKDDARVHPDMVRVPYRHLVTLVQITDEEEELKERIKRAQGVSSIDDLSWRHIRTRMACVRFWLDRFAPQEVKFSLLPQPKPDVVSGLDADMVRSVKLLRDTFSDLPWDAEAIHNAMYESTRANGIDPKVAFTAMYRILLAKDRGPRLGFFLSALDKESVLRRMDAAISMRE